MQELELMVAKQCAKVLQGLYPGIGEMWQGAESVPQFWSDSFYAQSKPAFGKKDPEVKLLKYQVLSFPGFDSIKPVVYLIAFHNLSDLSKIRHAESSARQGAIKNMSIDRMYVVNTDPITNIWERKAAACENDFVNECVVKESELRQIIEGGHVSVRRKNYSARDFYGISARKYDFSIPLHNERTDISIGHILPKKDEYMKILEFFRT
jgi:hypothetical protein